MGNSNRLFNVTFFTSLILHSLIFLPIPEFNNTQKNCPNKPHLNYVAIKVPVEVINRLESKEPEIKQTLKLPEKTSINEPAKEIVKKKESLYTRTLKTIHKMNAASDKLARPQRKIFTRTDESLKLEKQNNKSYTTYYKIINEHLQQAVIYPESFSEGEVALSFVLTRDGNLKSVEVIDETVQNDRTLKETAMKIVKNASPFPPFPENLHQQQLTFNIVFCFRERS